MPERPTFENPEFRAQNFSETETTTSEKPETLSPNEAEIDFAALLDQFEREQEEQEAADLEYERKIEDQRKLQVQESEAADRDAQRSRASRLRDRPALRSVLKIVSRDATLRKAIQVVTRRSAEFKKDVVKRFERPKGEAIKQAKEERFRNFTSLIAGLRLNNRSSEILDLAERRTFNADSDELWEKIDSGDNFVQELVIGLGQGASNYESTRLELYPESSSLAVGDVLGGEFGIAERGVWRLNNRNRPVNRALSPLPGTKGSLSEQGKYATMQASDYSGDAYQAQSDLGNATKDNWTLVGNAAVKTVVLNIKENKEGEGILEVELLNLKTGKKGKVRTNRVIDFGGGGVDRINLDVEDVDTARIIFEEGKKVQDRERPQLMTTNQMIEVFGDRANDFPLEGYKRVIIVGDRDSGLVAWGQLKGYEPNLGKTVRQLDNVESVTIVASDAALTREEFQERSRPNYVARGNELPRRKSP